MIVKTPKTNSYSQILKSSSIIGGAQGINYLIGMARVKVVAMLLGPSGVGLIGLYNSVVDLVGACSRLGINESGIREVAEAQGSQDTERVSRTVYTLRRACWATGVLGWIVTAALSYPLSLWTFGSDEHVWAIIVLGVTVFLGSITGGHSALIQGSRRISDFARLSMLVAIVGTLIAVGLYAWLGERGILPALITTAAVNLGFTWWFARKIPVEPIQLNWMETLANSKRLINLGLAFMYGLVLSTIAMLGIRAFIVRSLGVDASGIYQAAWGLSGMFGGFILSAMGTDFYPRLTAVAHDNEQVNRIVNEQIEIGVLLALPGIVPTITFAPWLMHIFYSPAFLPSAELLPWLAIGIFGQVVIFPLGYIQRAKGKVRWIFLSQTNAHMSHLILGLIMIQAYGIVAAAWAFALSTCIHGVVVFGIARRLSRFKWTLSSTRLVLFATGIIFTGFVSQAFVHGLQAFVLGAFMTMVSALFSLRGISARLGANHRIITFVLRLPGGRFVCGLHSEDPEEND